MDRDTIRQMSQEGVDTVQQYPIVWQRHMTDEQRKVVLAFNKLIQGPSAMSDQALDEVIRIYNTL